MTAPDTRSLLVNGLLQQKHSLYIEGRWHQGEGSALKCTNPATAEVLGEPIGASADQVTAAVRAARACFDGTGWREATNAAERAACLTRLAELIDEHHAELVDLVVDEVGSPVTLARSLQVTQPARNFRWLADVAQQGPIGGYEQRLEDSPGPVRAHSTLLREPVGVVAAIVPYNYPLNMVSWKLGPALAAGCTVVLLPSPQGTLCALALTHLIEQAGFPPGAVNLVIGGVDTSQALISSAGVDLVSFTGSSAVGAEVMALAARTTKKVILELGGKSPNILLPSADLSQATGQSILRYARNAGQGCGSTTRILVHADRYDDFVERAAAFLRDEVPVGDPRLEETVIGPLISGTHLERVEGYLARAVEQGAQVLAGGRRAAATTGWYLEGTLIGGVTNDQEICQEELFAPVAVVLPYADTDEALAIANDSRYGLNSAVWGDPEEAMRLARRLDAGTVAINGGGDARSDVPWGGGRSSGRGTEMGEDGFREFFRVRHVQWPVKTGLPDD